MATIDKCSAKDMRQVLLAYLEETVIALVSDCEAVIEERCHLTNTDYEFLPNGRPRWKNTLDFARAVATRNFRIVTCGKYLVSPNHVASILQALPKQESEQIIDRVLRHGEVNKKKPSNFTYKCPECGTVNKLNYGCGCGYQPRPAIPSREASIRG